MTRPIPPIVRALATLEWARRFLGVCGRERARLYVVLFENDTHHPDAALRASVLRMLMERER